MHAWPELMHAALSLIHVIVMQVEKNALDYARERKHHDIAEILINSQSDTKQVS